MKPLALVLVTVIAVAGIAVTVAQGGSSRIELRVWQSTSDSGRIYVSARPSGGPWQETVRVELDQENTRGTYRYGDLAVAVTIPEPTPHPESSRPEAAPATDGLPEFPDQFELRLGMDSWGMWLTASVVLPVRVNTDALYLYIWADPRDGNIACYNTFPILPEEGLTGLTCTFQEGMVPGAVTRIRGQLYRGEGGGRDYGCWPPDEPLPEPGLWFCEPL